MLLQAFARRGHPERGEAPHEPFERRVSYIRMRKFAWQPPSRRDQELLRTHDVAKPTQGQMSYLVNKEKLWPYAIGCG